jgi:hypothetical protein
MDPYGCNLSFLDQNVHKTSLKNNLGFLDQNVHKTSLKKQSTQHVDRYKVLHKMVKLSLC